MKILSQSFKFYTLISLEILLNASQTALMAMGFAKSKQTQTTHLYAPVLSHITMDLDAITTTDIVSQTTNA